MAAGTPIYDQIVSRRPQVDPPPERILLHTSYLRRSRQETSRIGYPPRAVARAYGCPVDQHSGRGAKIGVIELGGAYNPADMTELNLPTANVVVSTFAGAPEKPDGPDGADGEVMLDVEVIASVAPDAAIVLYFAPNDDTMFADAVAEAVNDGCQYISISWGGPEGAWTKRALSHFSDVLAAARASGVTVFAASGDNGSTDGTRNDIVDYPASDPNVVGCGGTKLILDASGRRTSEVTWDDDDHTSATGGGVSRAFPGRTVPDVAGNASPTTGYIISVDKQRQIAGGTSAVAPLYAAMCAVLAEAVGGARFDFLNTVLTNPTLCWDVTVGDNGGFRSGPGRDETTGFGVVDFTKLRDVLTSGAQLPAPGGVAPPAAPHPEPAPAPPQPAPASPRPDLTLARKIVVAVMHQLEALLSALGAP